VAGPGEECPPVDASRPSAPRVHDYLLGGKDNFAADRALAETLMLPGEGCPDLPGLVKASRQYILNGVRRLARRGIAQFIDCGCGMPAVPRTTVHGAAREILGGAAVLYLDRDAQVLCHVAALCKGPGLACAAVDVTDPAAVLKALAGPQAAQVIDLSRPAGIAFGGTLSAMPASAARAAVREVTAALAPGSAVVASGVSYADEGFGQAQAARFREAAGVTWYSHSPQDMASIFAAAGLAGGDGGPVTVADVQWPPPEGPRRGMVLGATGFKD